MFSVATVSSEIFYLVILFQISVLAKILSIIFYVIKDEKSVSNNSQTMYVLVPSICYHDTEGSE